MRVNASEGHDGQSPVSAVPVMERGLDAERPKADAYHWTTACNSCRTYLPISLSPPLTVSPSLPTGPLSPR